MKTPFCVALALVVALTATGAVQAHAKLVSADPPVNGIARAAPQDLDLTFSEEISGKLSGVSVKGPDGNAIPASIMIDRAGKGLMVMLRQPLKPGVYTVDWHAVASDDGHRTSGTYQFTVH